MEPLQPGFFRNAPAVGFFTDPSLCRLVRPGRSQRLQGRSIWRLDGRQSGCGSRRHVKLSNCLDLFGAIYGGSELEGGLVGLDGVRYPQEKLLEADAWNDMAGSVSGLLSSGFALCFSFLLFFFGGEGFSGFVVYMISLF